MVEADATNIDALRQLGAQEFSSAVVGVGTSIESSVLITVNLVDLGIEHLWVKAITPSHGKILTRIGANHVIYPEADAGVRAAHLVSGRMLDFIEFDDDFAIVKMYPPRETVGFTLDESKVRSKYGVTIVGVKSPGEDFTYARPETKVSARDMLIVSGPRGPAGTVRRPPVATPGRAQARPSSAELPGDLRCAVGCGTGAGGDDGRQPPFIEGCDGAFGGAVGAGYADAQG